MEEAVASEDALIDNGNPLRMYEALKSADKCLSLVEEFINNSMLDSNSPIFYSYEPFPQLTDNALEISDKSSPLEHVHAKDGNTLVCASQDQAALSQDVCNLKEEFEAAIKLRKHLDETIESLSDVNLSLKNKNSALEKKLVEIEAQFLTCKSQLDIKISECLSLKEKIQNKEESSILKSVEIDCLTSELHQLKIQVEQGKVHASAHTDLTRLKTHLIEIEDGYTHQVHALEGSKNEMELILQNTTLDLNRTKLNLQEARSNYDRHVRMLNEQLQHVSSEKDQLYSQVVNLSNLSQENEKTIASLHNSLNECQR
ncbi:hypothetical protein MXB_4539, partial [Myxobolus squamalis]